MLDAAGTGAGVDGVAGVEAAGGAAAEARLEFGKLTTGDWRPPDEALAILDVIVCSLCVSQLNPTACPRSDGRNGAVVVRNLMQQDSASRLVLSIVYKCSMAYST